jgi:hypothetical protein
MLDTAWTFKYPEDWEIARLEPKTITLYRPVVVRSSAHDGFYDSNIWYTDKEECGFKGLVLAWEEKVVTLPPEE